VKKLLLAGFALSALIAPAMAADMPVPAAPITTWTGYYIGANGGWGLSSDNKINSVGLPNNCSATVDVGCVQIPGFGPNNAYGTASAQAATFHLSTGSNGGFVGGGQFGYNYQTTTNTVVGLEADLQAVGSNGSATFSSVTQVAGFPVNPIAQTAAITSKLDFLGTVRARGGYLWNPNLYTYITAGLAYGEAEVNSSITQNIIGPGLVPGQFTPYTAVGTSKVVRFGATIGAGVEWLIIPNWSVKAEYLYVGLDTAGTATVNSTLANPDRVNGGFLSSVNVITSARFSDNILRGGVNYHF
jgi:outer membrane immunogenic protein